MDRVIAYYPAAADRDLMFCPQHGVAWARVMEPAIAYDEAYFRKCAAYDEQIARNVNYGRIQLVGRHHWGRVLDVGVGAGHFVESRLDTAGYDVNPAAVEHLKRIGKYSDEFGLFQAFTFWDVIEHVPAPQDYFDRIPAGAKVFASLPVFADLLQVRRSKHYRPGEHLYYFTEHGFIDWMRRYGFRLLEASDHERAAGREGIGAFAFVRETKEGVT